MAPRASWKGFLNLSLVSVPVKAYSAANNASTIRLNQLCDDCKSRIKQKIVCPQCGDLSRDQIVKGYEYAKDQYAVIDLDELDKLRQKDDTRAIKIDCFVNPAAVDPLHCSESSYYLLPDGPAGQKSYALLREAMSRKDLHCVAKVVLYGKEQLVLIRPLDDLLCMTTLRYAGQIKATSGFSDELTEHELSTTEFDLASTLIDETVVEDFDLARYSDEYTDKLTQLIEAKVNGREVVSAPTEETSEVINLMEALKASVQKAQASHAGGEEKASAKPMKKVASRKSAGKRKPSTKAKDALADKLANPKKKKATRKKKTG